MKAKKKTSWRETHKTVWVVTVDSTETEELETWVWDVYDFKPSAADLRRIEQAIVDDSNLDTPEDEKYSIDDWREYNDLNLTERQLNTRA